MNDVVIPYCIYHYIDSNTKAYWGFIGSPQKVKKKDGTISYRCAPEPKIFNGWFLAGVFYAIDPSFRPIPVGMKIFCAKRSVSFPYVTKNVQLMYDIYNIKDDCVYFTTYNTQVPNTVPLYFHKIGNIVFPSFDINPPYENPNWTKSEISQVFVMTSDTVGDITNDNHKGVKFNCVNGRCLPWIKDIPNIFDTDHYSKFLTLQDCVIFCSDLLKLKDKARPDNLLQVIRTQKKKIKQRNIKSLFKKISPMVITLVLTVFIILLFVIIHTSIYNKIKMIKN